MTALKTIKALQRLSAPHTVRVKNTFIEWVDPGDSDMKRSSSCPLLPGVPTRGTSPARNSHLKLASRKNTFDNCWPAGNAPTASNAMHDWRNSRADGHVDYKFSLSTQPSSSGAPDADDTSAVSTQATPPVLGASIAPNTEDDDTPTTKIRYGRASRTSFIDANVTTVVIRNLDRRMTLSTFLATLDDNGFQDTYDFAHLPFRLKKRNNARLAFVNFLTPVQAQLFNDRCQHMGAIFGRKSRKPCISPSNWQGCNLSSQRIVDSLKGKKGNKQTFPPIAFLRGKIVSFPQYI
eukprot:GEMP01031367.1.p1 GENE.GEMP01031367.1~~GEMP01031367.1.p1  ORF type:complete len:292 (+),score=44.20 GEMP01031367.1:241-1116(+)